MSVTTGAWLRSTVVRVLSGRSVIFRGVRPQVLPSTVSHIRHVSTHCPATARCTNDVKVSGFTAPTSVSSMRSSLSRVRPGATLTSANSPSLAIAFSARPASRENLPWISPVVVRSPVSGADW